MMKWHKKSHSSDLVFHRDNHIQRFKHILKQNDLNLNLNLKFFKFNLATHGMNSYFHFSLKYTMSPICFVNYNLPLDLSTTRTFIMFNLIIHGK
jgi:hypothetical protein